MTERKVLLKIRTVQLVPGDRPEIMELQSEGILKKFSDRVEISYPESELTGLEGVTTTFTIWGDKKLSLTRQGEKLKNKMLFEVGKKTDSLYDVGFGALLVSVHTQSIETNLNKGEFRVEYTVEVEHTFMGTNTYHVTFRYTD